MTEAKIVTPPRLPDGVTTNLRAFYAKADMPSGGYITALSAISFIASGSEWFAAAVAAHEQSEEANRSEIHAAAVWLEVQDNLSHHFPQASALSDAEPVLQGLLESGAVDGIARKIGSDRSEEIKPYAYADWSKSFERFGGLVLIPGYWCLKVNAAKLRRAIPARTAPAKVSKPGPDKLRLYEPVFKKLFANGFEAWERGGQQARWERVKTIWPAVQAKGWTTEDCPHRDGVNNNWEHFKAERIKNLE